MRAEVLGVNREPALTHLYGHRTAASLGSDHSDGGSAVQKFHQSVFVIALFRVELAALDKPSVHGSKPTRYPALAQSLAATVPLLH